MKTMIINRGKIYENSLKNAKRFLVIEGVRIRDNGWISNDNGIEGGDEEGVSVKEGKWSEK